ncbi:TIGR03086 family metal-binding protein [Sporichthya sp.]|uniref:TIGR03086 family metal-binding protein n=1 Tax=Sporichthya sp. TaxID=65475 RepID=UPI001835C27B|nr:TIGR03086 family metal-binding protein [Sporichthya sp.]MBA3744489.1 TIGR03086 family protein [Sporichthya sp.]
MSDTLDRYRRLADDLTDRVEAAPEDAWANSSPCAGWTARDVMAHVIGNARAVLDRLTGVEHVPAPVTDVVKEWSAARADVEAVLADPERAGAPVDTPFGPMPVESFIGRFQCMDILIHTWDVARATGGDENIDATAAAEALAGLRAMGDVLRGPGLFKPETTAPPDADVITQLMCFCGREV